MTIVARRARPLCGLCNEPKVAGGNDAWLCNHCDTTVNCRGASTCGACRLAREKQYPTLPDRPYDQDKT